MLVDDMSKGKIYNLNKNLRSKLIQVPIEKLSLGKFNNIVMPFIWYIDCKISLDNFCQSTKKIYYLYLFLKLQKI